jgi:protease I
MPTRRPLKGRTIAALAADGFEKVELVIPLRALKRAGAKVHMPASRVGVNKTISEADPGDYDGLLLPGGFINPDLLRQSAPARQFVRAFAASDKPIATLCHGPWVLASAGLLEGRTLTSWPGIRDDLVNAGATWLDQEIVRDGNLTTSRGPQDIAAFVPAMLATFAKTAPEPSTTAPGHESDPQRTPRHGRRRVAMVAQADSHRRGGHRLDRCRPASSAWPGCTELKARGRGRALGRGRRDDAEGVDETAFGGAWRTDASQHVTHAAPLSEVAELARGRSASGRAIELDWVFIDPAQRGSSSAAWAGLPRDSIAHGSTTLATKRRECRTEIEQPLVSPPPRRPGCPTQKAPSWDSITDGTSALTIRHVTRSRISSSQRLGDVLQISNAACSRPSGGVSRSSP